MTSSSTVDQMDQIRLWDRLYGDAFHEVPHVREPTISPQHHPVIDRFIQGFTMGAVEG